MNTQNAEHWTRKERLNKKQDGISTDIQGKVLNPQQASSRTFTNSFKKATVMTDASRTLIKPNTPLQVDSNSSSAELAETLQHDDPSAGKDHSIISMQACSESEFPNSSRTLSSCRNVKSSRKNKGKICNKTTLLTVFTVGLLVVILVVTLEAILHRHFLPFSCGTQPKTVGGALSPQTEGSAPLDFDRAAEFIHAAIDLKAVPACTPALKGKKLCRNATSFITSSDTSVHPLRCVDDANQQNSSLNGNGCDLASKTFRLNPRRGRIQVLRGGVFLIILQVTIRLSEAAQLHFGVAVNGERLALLCSVSSHGASGPGSPAPYTQCSGQIARSLHAGDNVSLFSAQSGVPLQGLPRSTYIQLVRQSGG